MTAFNAVRFRVKPGREQEFLDAHKKVQANWPGLEQSYCQMLVMDEIRRRFEPLLSRPQFRH